MQIVIEMFERMSDDLKGAIITAVLTSIISVIGFILTNKNMSKNLKNELQKEKTSVHIQKMSKMPYDILCLMDTMVKKSQVSEESLDEFKRIMNTVCAYGSKDAIKIASTMQSENYQLDKAATKNSYRILAFYPLLVTQIKYDVTNIVNSPELWFRLKINDYENLRDLMVEENNKIVDELDLNKEFKI
ncbi:hypothetical protein [Dorea sp. AM10-31]|uniref:hypothetical protein n=1 Tax=Dorea sp. AM10-31 TaxID=2293098 RepID=UPI000E40CE1C|nr:hypothetical protein [Dorea sp. AM10-31]RGF21619.1 hypothetical protein DW125_11225 [Dorea sp. AM10-31]